MFRAITETLATLPTGECWAWMAGTDQPVRTKVQAKKSLHPDRTVMRDAKAVAVKPVDVGAFVSEMKTSLVDVEKEAALNDPAALRRQVAELQKALKGKPPAGAPVAPSKRELDAATQAGYEQATRDHAAAFVATIGQLAPRVVDVIKAAKIVLPKVKGRAVVCAVQRPALSRSETAVAIGMPGVRHVPAFGGLNGPQRKILRSLQFWRSIGHDEPSKEQVAAVAGYSAIGGAFGNPIGQLRSSGMVDYPRAGCVTLSGDAPIDEMGASEAKAMLLSVLGGPERKIAEAFGNKAGPYSREEIASRAGYAPVGGAFVIPSVGYARLVF